MSTSLTKLTPISGTYSELTTKVVVLPCYYFFLSFECHSVITYIMILTILQQIITNHNPSYVTYFPRQRGALHLLIINYKIHNL